MSRVNPGRDLVLVDDDEIVHLFVQRQLRRTGLMLEAFTDSERARDWLQVYRPSLLLLDHRMPRLDGPALLHALGGPATAAQRILLCTADSDTPDLRSLASEPAVTVLNKTDVLDRRRFLSVLGLGAVRQCADTASAPDSCLASSGLPVTRADAR